MSSLFVWSEVMRVVTIQPGESKILLSGGYIMQRLTRQIHDLRGVRASSDKSLALSGLSTATSSQAASAGCL